MSTNAPTSRRIMYMHCHVDGMSLEVIFFSKKYFNRKFLFLIYIYTYFSLSSKLHFVFLLALHFESSSNFPSLCTFFFIYIKRTIVEKLDLNFFKELFWFLGVFNPTWESRLEFTVRNPLRKSTWIHCEKSFQFFNHLQLWINFQTCNFFFFRYALEIM